MEIVLLCLVTALLAFDQTALTGILHRPVAACTLIGAVLGDVKSGVIIGGILEGMLIAFEQTNHFTGSSANFVLFSTAACIFCIKAGVEPAQAAVMAGSLSAIGTGIAYTLFNLNTVFINMSRKAAETRDEKKLTLSIVLPILLNLLVTVALTAAAYSAGTAFADNMTAITDKWGWILNSMNAAGILLPCIGFAVLLRNIGTKDITGALYAGIAAGALLVSVSAHEAGMTMAVLAAAAIAAYDFHAQKKAGNEPAAKGGAQKWW